jgi:hypothetical protein
MGLEFKVADNMVTWLDGSLVGRLSNQILIGLNIT